MRAPTECLRCKAAMEPGFLLEIANQLLPQTWYAGEPTKSFWNGLKVQGVRGYQVRTFRCTACGYLESYTGDAVQS